MKESFDRAVTFLSALTDRTAAMLIPVYTNLRHLDDDDNVWVEGVLGAGLAAVAHAFQGRVARALIASSDDVMAGLIPIGSHPLLDPNYSSADVSIVHHGTWMTRMDKVRLLSEWDDGLQHLRTCFDFFRPAVKVNCGRCEKCLRTMTALLVCGKLDQCTAYPFDDVTPEMLGGLEVWSARAGQGDRRQTLDYAIQCIGSSSVKAWKGLLPLLVGIDRHDLAAIVKEKIEKYEKSRGPAGWERLEGKDSKFRPKVPRRNGP